MAYLQSSQVFVRTLKAPNDPPNADSPAKIDIAREVWEGSSINVQNKAETIADFVLTRLLKDKGKTPDSPVTDTRYWQLLSSVISALPLSGSSAASTMAWLLPLLNRVPLVPICASLLGRANEMDQRSATALLDVSSQAIAILWPLASPKSTADALLDCFGALLSVASRLPNDSAGLARIGTGVCASLLDVFNNSSNKKKLHQTFAQAHLRYWVDCIAYLEEREIIPVLSSNLYRTGQEILFNADTLKSLAEPSSLKALFTPLPASEASLRSLPKLLRSFAVATRKNWALFGQNATSAATAARAVAMVFYAQCADYVRSAMNELSGDAWASRLALLRIVEKESLLGFGQADGQQVIRKEVSLCVAALALDGTANADSALILDSLSVVSRIDHDLLEPQLPELLPRLLVFPSLPHAATASAVELLTLCVSYHSRARSIPNFLEHVQGVFASLTSHQGSARLLYPRAASCPLFARSFTTALARDIQTFVTPGQVLPIAQDIASTLERAYETYASLTNNDIGDGGVGPRKKARRLHSPTVGPTTAYHAGIDAAAISFALLARMGAYIFPALPIQTLTAEMQEDVKACICRADFAKENLFSASAQDGDNRRTDTWAAHVMLAATLRLAYALHATPRLRFPSLQPECHKKIVEVYQSSKILPELFLESARYLLKAMVTGKSDEQLAVFDQMLVYLEQHLKMPRAWNGRSAELAYGDDGASQAAVGLLKLLLDRFIHVFDVIASQPQLDRLAELLSKAAASAHMAIDALTPAMVAKDCLRSAQLWEHHRLRTSLLSSITVRLQGIEAVRYDAIVDANPHSLSWTSIGLKSDMVDRVLEGFHMLLYCPAEYLTKSSRVDLLRRAVTFDMAVTASKFDENHIPLASKVVRTFLQRTFYALGSAEHEHSQAYLESLVRSVGADDAVDQTTLEIIDAHVRTTFRTAQQGSVNAASKHLATLLPLRPKQSSSDVDERMDILRERLMSVLVEDFTTQCLPAGLRSTLCTFQEHIFTRIKRLTRALAQADGTSKHGSIVALTSACLRFSAWLGLEVNAMPLKATDLMQSLVSKIDPSRQTPSGHLNKAVFDLLVAEFECKSGAREDLLAEILASHIALSQVDNPSDKKELDELLRRTIRRIPVEEFASSLDLVAEMLCEGGDIIRLSGAVHLGSVLLRGAPEGTLKTTQAFFTRALSTFAGYAHYTSCHPLRVQTLDFIDQQCCDRPASLRLINLTTIWPLLARILTGTTTRDEQTSSVVFHKIVSIIGALVRLRRDLVVNTLPHLCIVLRLLVSSLRGPRPNLGEKQRRTVADSLPAWVNLDHPLGVGESRALARLMTTLVTKTIVRVHTNPSEAQKAESIARPLAKHVAYVIQTYLEAVNDALCVVPLAVRQELMPGLFVLCGMLNEHDRDALMVSGLNAAGKVTLKALWKDYEKQRYVGKG